MSSVISRTPRNPRPPSPPPPYAPPQERRNPTAANQPAWTHVGYSPPQRARAEEWLDAQQDPQAKIWSATGAVKVDHLRQLLSGEAAESSTSRTVFDAAWSLACQRSGLQFSDGPSTMLDKGRHIAVPLRFWEKTIGRNPRTLRSWLRVPWYTAPSRIG